MKRQLIFLFTFMLLISPAILAQASSVDLEGTELTASVPESWELSKDNLVITLAPKAKDLKMKIEITDETDINKVVNLSMDEIKKELPNDVCCTAYDIEINDIPCKEIKFVSKDNHIVCYTFFTSPAGKIVKLSIFENEALCNKYKEDLKLIKNGIKKKV